MSGNHLEFSEKPATKPVNPAVSKAGLIVAIVVVSCLGGGLGSWLLSSKATTSAEAGSMPDGGIAASADPIANAIQNGGAIPLEPFLVNLADTESARYLRIKISLMLDDKKGVKELSENLALQMKVRDLVVQILTQKTSEELMSEAGKKELRLEIRERIDDYFRKPKLVDVMFTDFVIQL